MQTRRLALFDLDNTLLTGDSDVEWLNFLIDQGIVDRATEEDANQRMAQRYRDGSVGTLEFVEFYLRTFVPYPMETLIDWRWQYVATCIVPRIPRAARDLLASHVGDLVVIITATNRFLTEPIAIELGVEHLIATDPQLVGGRFTGKVDGVPCFREGKITRLEQWLTARGRRFDEFEDTCFYSDSINDRFLLERVAHPVAVDPDASLAALANERGWPVLKLQRG
jgi:HAD superfamily hydrolase (TIGR01490 family)